MAWYRLSAGDRARFADEGYFIVPGLLSADEVAALEEVTRSVIEADSERLDRHDGEGLLTLLSLRNELREDAFSACVRSARIVRTMEALLGDEVYHYHHKLMIKEPRVGGAWEWHQDYGYWYQNGCLRPDMASCMVAITRATRANGCVEVVPGSHCLGRIDHVEVGDQVCADPERVAEVLKRWAPEACELEPGDGLFFHANLLHRSLRNESEEPRLSLIQCYNARSNEAYKAHHHPGYAAIEVLEDDAVLEAGLKQARALRGSSS